MKPLEEQLNDLIVDAYRSILRVEETILKRVGQHRPEHNEMHMLEAVGKGKNKPKTISEIAEDLGITLPSVTVAINKLVKKGYVEKLRGEEDARIVYVTLTKQGKKIDSVHRYFHESMVRSTHQRHERTGAAGAVSGNPEARPFLKEKDQRVRHPDNGKGKPTCFKYSQPQRPAQVPEKQRRPLRLSGHQRRVDQPAHRHPGAGGLHRRDADPAAGDRLQPGAGARGGKARGAGPDSLRHHPRGLHHSVAGLCAAA